jgi:FkbM family methyltransferase
MVDVPPRLEPFGSFFPRGIERALMAVGQRLPFTWLGRRVSSLIRSTMKRLSQRPIDAIRLGSRMRLHAHGNACEKRLLVSPQFFDPEVLALLGRAVKPGFVFIDIGANVGAYSLFVAKRTSPPARVLAIEPHPEAQRRLFCNLELNGLDWVESLPVALNDASGAVELFISERNIGSTTICQGQSSDIPCQRLEVPCDTLLGVVRRHGLPWIDAIKADVEGAEDRVLAPFFADAPPALWPRLLVIEDNRQSWRQDLLALLERCGYVTALASRGNIVLTCSPDSSGA